MKKRLASSVSAGRYAAAPRFELEAVVVTFGDTTGCAIILSNAAMLCPGFPKRAVNRRDYV
jgi:hypothetical protein